MSTVIIDKGIETPLDKHDSVREFFTDEEWLAIYDSVHAECVIVHEDEMEVFNSVLRKIDRLMGVPDK